jgi:hypothetical protein
MDRVELDLRRALLVTARGSMPVGVPAPAVERLCLGDLDGDGKQELLAVVVQPTKRDQTFRRRLLVHEIDLGGLRPEPVEQRGAAVVVHAGVADLDGDGRAELLLRERSRDGEQTRVVQWSRYRLTELPALAEKAPAYAYGPRYVATPTFAAAAERLPVPSPRALSFQRTAAQSRQIQLGPGLGNAVNRGKYHWLNGEARAALQQQGFVVVRPKTGPDEFHSLYIRNQYDGLPSFVTSDAALHLIHVLLDDVLVNVERELLGPALQRLLEGMRGQGRLLRGRLPADLEGALERVLFRLDVAASLLEGHAHGLDAERARQVAREIASIEARGRGQGPLGEVDYGGFVVRGHYTRSEALGRFFKATLLLYTAATQKPDEAALLTALALSDPRNRALVALLDDFGRTLVGPAASRTPLALAAQARQAFGPAPSWSELGSKPGWLGRAEHHPAQPLGAAVTLLARRWPADNGLLTVDMESGELPDPLYVLAALGSDRARAHLDGAMQARPSLAHSLGEARTALQAGRLGDTQSVGGRFLLSLRWLLLPYPEGYPAFQRTDGWSDHNLVSAAASWAEWRRDTILHVQPPLVWAEGGDEDALPPGKAGFVEPVPELFAELAALLGDAHQLLDEAGYFGAPSGKHRSFGHSSRSTLQQMEELMSFLADAARGELAGQGLAREKRERLSDIGPWLERVLAGDGTLRLPPVPVIADVSYVEDPAGVEPDQVLTVGTGPVDVIVVAMPLGRRVVLARGAVSSFYSFAARGPLTDEQWRAKLAAGQAPPQPGWAKPVHLSGSRGFAPRPRPPRPGTLFFQGD